MSPSSPLLGVHRSPTANLHPSPTLTVVVLDVATGGNGVALRRRLHDINDCTSSDQIRVVARRAGDRGRALAALSTTSPSTRAVVLA